MNNPVNATYTAVPDVRAEVSEFEQLRERAHEQIAALAVTVARLERLRADIERHLPRQPTVTAPRLTTAEPATVVVAGSADSCLPVEVSA